MLYWLFILLCCPLYSEVSNKAEPDVAANFDAEPSTFVGKVNVITGAYQEASQDLVIPGAEPLIIQRAYCCQDYEAGTLFNGWNLNHGGSFLLLDHNPTVGIITGAFGSRQRFIGPKLKEKSINLLTLDLELMSKGLTNTASGRISGKTNRKNQLLKFDTKNGQDSLETGNGSTYYYKYNKHVNKEAEDHQLVMLYHVVKPNGNKIVYKYDDFNRIRKISTTSASDTVFASAEFIYPSPEKFKENPSVTIKASDGRTLSYQFERVKGTKVKNRYFLSSAERAEGPKETYRYDSTFRGIKYTLDKKTDPDGRYLATIYYKNDKFYRRVESQIAPLGTKLDPIKMHRFVYHIDEKLNNGRCNYTDVFDANDHLTRYFYSDDEMLTMIVSYQKDNVQPYRYERFVWGKAETANQGNLICRYIETPDKKILCGKAYKYDLKGNVIQEILFGDLTGTQSIPPKLDKNGYPIDNGCDKYIIGYKYSQDGKNLVLEETYPNGKKVTFKYQPGTDLVTARLTYDKERLALREFFTYDANAVLIASIRDDGSSLNAADLTGVTERMISRIQPKASTPCLGLPETVSELCLDIATGKEMLIKKIVNHYDSYGHLEKQDHYDSQNVLAYTLSWTYNKFGHVTKETNAIGDITTRTYDDYGNILVEQGPDSRWHKEFRYDYMNRLIREEIVYAKDQRFGNSHSYDYLGNRIATFDPHNNETKYTYDSFSRLIKVTKPPVSTKEGPQRSPEICYSYNLLNQCTCITDPRQFKTEKSYNLRGQPIAIRHPDGTTERYTYTLEGKVDTLTDKAGNITFHTYDFLGNLTKKSLYGPNGDLLSVETASYNTFHLLSEIDAGGIETTYTYDSAGRLSSKTCGNAKTTYQYDTMGRVYETREWLNEKRYSAKVHCYDNLNRVIEERVEDEKKTIYSKILYEYDANGKQSKMTQVMQESEAITTTEYDSLGRITVFTDPEENKSITEYNDYYKNAVGQTVLQTTQTDPLGNKTVSTYDALGRITSVDRFNQFGEKVQSRTVLYDLSNNKEMVEEHVFVADEHKRDIKTLFEYDAENRLIHLTEAANTPEQKHQRWTYDKSGRKEKAIKPDGVEICHSYDALGRLKTYQASDDSFHYAYSYNSQNLPTEIKDLCNAMTTKREYNGSGRLIKETLGNGLVVEYTYDALGRPLTNTMPDGSGVAYAYQGPYLNTVERLDKDGTQRYVHTYTERDLGGNPLKEQMILSGGTLTHHYDKLSRALDIQAGMWHESDLVYDAVGNLISRQLNEGLGNTSFKYQYDSLNQLIEEEGHRYAHDSLYNRIEKDGNLCECNLLNQLQSDGRNRYTYDRNGNLFTKTASDKNETLYTYDALDRLVGIKTENKEITYSYDAFNRRLTKTTDDNEVTRYLYAGQNEIGTQSNDGSMRELRVLGTGKCAEIGAAIAIEIDGETFIPVHDHNGNVAALLNGEGNLVEAYRYSGFGEEQCVDASGNSITEPKSPWRFSSKRHDSESGLIHFGRRNYDPETGRWITPDPIGLEGGPNLYAYVGNNPWTHYDAYGLFSLGDIFGGFFRLIGSVLGIVSYHGIPGVLFKDIFLMTAAIFSGDGLDNFVPSYREQHSTTGQAGTWDDDAQPIDIHVNGVLTLLDEVDVRCNILSKKASGKVFHYVYNATHGFIRDILEWAGQRLGIPTNSAEKLVSKVKEIMAENPGRSIRLWLHSQGGEIGAYLQKVLTKEELSIIEVNTFGSANLFDQGHFARVTHYVGTGDLIPLIANPIEYAKACFGFRPDIKFVKTYPFQLKVHSMEGPAYDRTTDHLLQNII